MKYFKYLRTLLATFFLLLPGFASAAEVNLLNKEDSHQKIEAAIRTKLKKPEGALTEQDFKSIKELQLRGLGLSDISPLSRMTSIKYLDISDNGISDLSPIVKLPLAKLTFHNNRVVDISVLASMKGIKYIYGENNQISDLSALAKMNFSQARLLGNPLEKIDLPTKLKSRLRYRELSPQESNIALEKALRKQLKKSETEITQDDYDSITSLHLGGMGLSDISALKKCRNLTSLNLQMNDISDVSPLAEMTKLTLLDLSNNKIVDISPLKNLVDLRTLIIYFNHIEDISAVANMKDLNFLSAYCNKIKVVKYVHHMKTARRIKFHVNPVPFEAQEECHKHLPDVELMFKRDGIPNYYMPQKTNKK